MYSCRLINGVRGCLVSYFTVRVVLNQYAVQKTLTKIFGTILLLLELSCLRYAILRYRLRMLLCVFMTR